jgi:hypothetical protein
LYLFVKDLMDGVNGAILDLKDRRDNAMRRKVSKTAKISTWLFLGVVASAILFYLYLFGIRQTKGRQAAWFKSFVVWIVLEVLLVSSACVMVQHVLLPLLAMADVRKVKDRVVRDIIKFNALVKRSVHGTGVEQSVKKGPPRRVFNAATFFFPSYKLAQLNSGLAESEVILHYCTAFPKKAFRSSSLSGNVKNSYDMRFAFITQAFSRVALFALTSLVQMPPPVQDAVTDILSMAGIGYVTMLHVTLYKISPVLAFLPALTAILIVHFLTASGKSSSRLDRAQTHPITKSIDDDEEDEANVISDPENDAASGVQLGADVSGAQEEYGDWKSHRATLLGNGRLANRLANRLRPSDHDAIVAGRADSWEESSDGSESFVARDASGNRVIVWEEDGDAMDPDLAANRFMYQLHDSFSDSDERHVRVVPVKEKSKKIGQERSERGEEEEEEEEGVMEEIVWESGSEECEERSEQVRETCVAVWRQEPEPDVVELEELVKQFWNTQSHHTSKSVATLGSIRERGQSAMSDDITDMTPI